MGTDCVKRFNGMFAFAIWDKGKRELSWLEIIWGSSRCITSRSAAASVCVGNQGLDAGPDVRAKWIWRRWPSYLLSALSRHRRLCSKESSSCRRATRCGLAERRGLKSCGSGPGFPQLRKRWHEAELIEEYQALLEDAVRLQMRSDVPLGLFLSSGVDSGVLLAIMSKYSSGPVQAFTIGFEEGEKTNEVEDAENGR